MPSPFSIATERSSSFFVISGVKSEGVDGFGCSRSDIIFLRANAYLSLNREYTSVRKNTNKKRVRETNPLSNARIVFEGRLGGT
jgi:hypothetical protein